jgi:hypothetical protein
MAVDGQLVARTLGELRATLPQEGDLLASLGRVVEATRTVVGVDGTGLTLAHEDGQPRWVAVSDAAMELLEQIQHDFGEGPCLAAFAEDRVVAVEDLGSELVWDRVAAVVGQLHVRGVLSVPVRPADREVEVAQLRQALASRVWIEQAKGVLAATRGSVLTRRFSSSTSRRGRPRASWPTWPKRSSRRRNASGSPPGRSMTFGFGRPRRGPGRPSRPCRQPRPGWPDGRRRWTGPRTTSTRGSGPLTSATTSPTHASRPLMNASGPPTSVTGPPAIPSSAFGYTKRQQGTSEAAPERLWPTW